MTTTVRAVRGGAMGHGTTNSRHRRLRRRALPRTMTLMHEPLNQNLLDALSTMPPIPGLTEAVLAAVGAGTLEGYRQIPVLGYHLSVGVDVAAVYIVTDRIFALFEANAAGRSYTLSVGLPRVRRVGRLEDAEYTRVVIELDADRATTVSTMNADGRAEGVVIPAGYELVEATPDGRADLRRFQIALSMAIAL